MTSALGNILGNGKSAEIAMEFWHSKQVVSTNPVIHTAAIIWVNTIVFRV